jgi:hypothetical protein
VRAIVPPAGTGIALVSKASGGPEALLRRSPGPFARPLPSAVAPPSPVRHERPRRRGHAASRISRFDRDQRLGPADGRPVLFGRKNLRGGEKRDPSNDLRGLDLPGGQLRPGAW